MHKVDERLRELGLALPLPTATLFSYVPAIRYRDTVHVAGQIPKTSADTLLVQGVVGDSVNEADARAAVKLCVLHGLAWVAHHAGGTLDAVEQVLRVDYFFQAGRSRGGLSMLADEGSELLIALFGDAGRHPRSVIGVSELPRNAPVLVSMDIALAEAGARDARPR